MQNHSISPRPRLLRDLPLAHKLILMMAVVVAVTLGVTFLVVRLGGQALLQQQLGEEMYTHAKIIAANSRAALAFGDPEAAGETLAALGEVPAVVTAVLYDVGGHPFARYTRPGAEVVAAPQPTDREGFSFAGGFVLAHRHVHLQERELGSVVVLADTGHFEALARRYATYGGVLFLGALVLAVLLALLLQGQISRPLQALTGLMARISAGREYGLRAGLAGRDEIGQLAAGFDGMLDRIQQRDRELERHRDHLEELVERRTAALSESEARIKASLQEKEVLLREIHHRVKNNMQVISSLLAMQTRQFADGATRDALEDSRSRVRSMALVHEKLYQTEDLARIDFADYLRSLASSVLSSHGTTTTGGERIALDFDLEPLELGLDSAIPCGLITNELITNAVKYAFPEGGRGTVRVGLHPCETAAGPGCELVVADDGVGLPEGLDPRQSESLGLRLVTQLAGHQLHGEVELAAGDGTEFRIRFPLPEEAPEGLEQPESAG